MFVGFGCLTRIIVTLGMYSNGKRGKSFDISLDANVSAC